VHENRVKPKYSTWLVTSRHDTTRSTYRSTVVQLSDAHSNHIYLVVFFFITVISYIH